MDTNAKTATKYGKPHIGCYLDHANYNVDDLNRETIKFAIGLGYTLDADQIALIGSPDDDFDLSRDDDGDESDVSQILNEIADEAIDWLNEQETRSFLYWANEGEANAFGLWPNVDGAREDCAFVSSKSKDYPPEDYRGEWLHVSDHGNATLYVREDGGPGSDDSYQDEEIWSVV